MVIQRGKPLGQNPAYRPSAHFPARRHIAPPAAVRLSFCAGLRLRAPSARVFFQRKSLHVFSLFKYSNDPKGLKKSNAPQARN
jgi:hypothetical protein